MSALDQAFIKVFKQDTQKSAQKPAAAQADSTGPHLAASLALPETRQEAYRAAERAAAASQVEPTVDSLYADGAFYRDTDADDPFPQPAAGPHARSRRNTAACSPAGDAPRDLADHNQLSPAMQSVCATESAPDSCYPQVETRPLEASQIVAAVANQQLLNMDWLDEHLLSLQLRTPTSTKAITPEPITPEPVAPEPVTSQTVAPEPIAPQAVAPEPIAPEPVAPQQGATEPVDLAESTQEPTALEVIGLDEVDSEAVDPQTVDSETSDLDVPTTTAGNAAEVAWEVDRLQWPTVCDQLYQARKTHFDHCGAKLLAATGEGLRVLAVSSSERGEGRTTLALCLARAAAAAGVRVAVLETDFGHINLGSLLQVDTPCDWPHAVRSGLPWTEAAIWSIEDRITLLPLSDEVADEDTQQPLRLDDPMLTQLIADLRRDFELLVIDTPPIGDVHSEFFQAGDDCPIDAAILVRDQRVAVATHTLRIVERIRDAGVEAVGIAHNYSKAASE